MSAAGGATLSLSTWAVPDWIRHQDMALAHFAPMSKAVCGTKIGYSDGCHQVNGLHPEVKVQQQLLQSYCLFC